MEKVSLPAEQDRPIIKRLIIRRFRGINQLDWLPSENLNIIIGGGDTGKTTILEAISLLFAPTNFRRLSDVDFYNRHTETELVIEADVRIPIHHFPATSTVHLWPWAWNGAQAILPNEEVQIPVYKVRVSVDSDLELAYRFIQPNDEQVPFSVGMRKSLGIVDLTQVDNHNKDLRLVSGSTLEKLFDRDAIRKAAAQASEQALESDEHFNSLTAEPLHQLSNILKTQALPYELSLGLTLPPTASLMSLIGLMAQKGTASLPISSWGTGTRNLVVLSLAQLTDGGSGFTLIDEVERGLEPYRQRRLVRLLGNENSQTFITTHSGKIIDARPAKASVWNLYVEASQPKIGAVDDRTLRILDGEAEALFARLPIIAEGATEVGFLRALLTRVFKVDLLDYGIHISNGGGNEKSMQVLENFSRAGIQAAGFLDDENRRWSGKAAKLKGHYDDLFFQWPKGCLEENIIPLIPLNNLEAFITLNPARDPGQRLESLQKGLGVESKQYESLLEEAGGAGPLRDLILNTALEKRISIPGYNPTGNGRKWFKSVDGGIELANKVLDLGIWDSLQPTLSPFLTAVAKSVDIHWEGLR